MSYQKSQKNNLNKSLIHYSKEKSITPFIITKERKSLQQIHLIQIWILFTIFQIINQIQLLS